MFKVQGSGFRFIASPDEANLGFKNVILKPQFVMGLDHFESTHNGPFGKIISSWKRAGDNILYKVTIPPNSTANLILGASSVLEDDKDISKNKGIENKESVEGVFNLRLESGSYVFTVLK